ncbi:MAG: ATP-grasp domain-containing protein [bacterium]|nr:ATP-grasp domain-containing protein [bacterium]
MSLKNKTCLIAYNPSLDHPTEDFDSSLESRDDIKAVRRALKELGVRTQTLGLKKISPNLINQLKKDIRPDFVFNLCETFAGRNHAEMHVASFFELLNLPYTGSPPLALGLAVNKMRCKNILRMVGVPTAAAVNVAVGERLRIGRMKPPFIIKPALEDGSFGLSKNSVVYDLIAAERQIAFIHENFRQSALVEQYIEGREVTIAVIHQPPFSFGVGEILFDAYDSDEPHIISYEAKWAVKPKISLTYPAVLDSAMKNKLEKIAGRAFRAIGCRDYARIDVRIDKNNQPYVLEVNPNPDISPKSEFENLAKTSGLTYTDFIKTVAENTLNRRADSGLEL